MFLKATVLKNVLKPVATIMSNMKDSSKPLIFKKKGFFILSGSNYFQSQSFFLSEARTKIKPTTGVNNNDPKR